MKADVLVRETGRALARSGGSRAWTETQRRVLAALVIMQECTADQAEAALEEGERELNARGYVIPWHVDGDGDLSYPLRIALDGFAALHRSTRSRLRLVQGGAP